MALVTEVEEWVTRFLHITVEEWRAMSADEAVRLLMGEDGS
jgi:hypothetical protein